MRLRGAVRLAGRVTDADGEPLPGASVSLVDDTGAVVAAARTARDGRYAVDDLVGGVYTLAATGPARPAVAARLDLPATGHAEHNVSLLPGARVFGVARDDRWRPLAGIRVALLDSRGTVVVETITSRDGAYAFRDLREGMYTVVATGYPRSPRPCRSSAASSTSTTWHCTTDRYSAPPARLPSTALNRTDDGGTEETWRPRM
ncbi:collagen binding domain-containing protein [Luedemannella flava]